MEPFRWHHRGDLGGHEHEVLEELMSGLSDVQAAVLTLQNEEAAVVATVNDLVALVATLQAAQASGDDAALETAAGQINQVATSLQGLVSSDPGAQGTVPLQAPVTAAPDSGTGDSTPPATADPGATPPA
jgi:hypothetical protein